jgi:hypothetical protein
MRKHRGYWQAVLFRHLVRLVSVTKLAVWSAAASLLRDPDRRAGAQSQIASLRYLLVKL